MAEKNGIEREKKYFYVIKKSDEESDGKNSGYLGHVIQINEFNGQKTNLTGHQSIINQMDIFFNKGEYVYDKSKYSMKKIKPGTASLIGLSKDVPGKNLREIFMNIEKMSISDLEVMA